MCHKVIMKTKHFISYAVLTLAVASSQIFSNSDFITMRSFKFSFNLKISFTKSEIGQTVNLLKLSSELKCNSTESPDMDNFMIILFEYFAKFFNLIVLFAKILKGNKKSLFF